MKRPLKHLILAGAMVVTVTVAVPATKSAAVSKKALPRCKTSQLRGKYLDSTGAAGTIVFSVTLKNTGKYCSLRGYPRLRIRGAHGPLPTHVIHGGISELSVTPELVKIRHNGKASVLVSYRDVPIGSETSCPTGSALQLKPPKTKSWLQIKVTTEACGHGTLHTSPILSGVHHAP